jgi:hypothetical protein
MSSWVWDFDICAQCDLADKARGRGIAGVPGSGSLKAGGTGFIAVVGHCMLQGWNSIIMPLGAVFLIIQF